MSRFNSPLDNIRVASPCPADWEGMYGDERKRFCGECKLNVYNLSGMTRQEAENLIANWEGRLCVRFYRRADGSVLTADCPVGWAAVERRLSRAATAVFSMFAGLFSGVAGATFLEIKPAPSVILVDPVPAVNAVPPDLLMGEIPPEREPLMGKPVMNDPRLVETKGEFVVGMKAAPEGTVVRMNGRRR